MKTLKFTKLLIFGNYRFGRMKLFGKIHKKKLPFSEQL